MSTTVHNTSMKVIYTTDIFDRWLAKLRNKVAVAKIRSRMDRLEIGNAGDVKAVGEGVQEMRIHTGAGYRIYFLERGLEIVVLLCGGDKSSQQKDIEQAKTLAKNL